MRFDSVPFALVAAGLLAVTAGLLLAAFPGSFLLGNHPFWSEPRGDLGQHMTGAAYFARGPWMVPLFHVPALGLPEGTNIVFTDSIPLVALIARILYQATGTYWHGFGVWFAVCALLQPVVFALLLRAWGVRDGVVLFLGGLLALFTPFFLIRFGHLALCGHWVLLLALAVHGQARRSALSWSLTAAFGGIVLLGLLIHPYLFVFALCVLLMTVLQGLWGGTLGLPGALARLGAVLAPLAPVMLVTGHLGEPMRPKPFGEYALNILSPFVPQHSGLVPGLADWSLAGFETMVWVGMGGALVIALALWANRRVLARAAADSGGDLAALLVLTLFACTYAVQAGPWLVLGLPPDLVRAAMLAYFGEGVRPTEWLGRLGPGDWLRLGGLAALWLAVPVGIGLAAWRLRRYRFLVFVAGCVALAGAAAVLAPLKVAVFISNFQASARFAWIAIYLAMAASVAGLARRWPRAAVWGVLAAALALQMADTRPLTDWLRSQAAGQPAPLLADQDAIAAAFAAADRVELVPTYLCAFIAIPDGPSRLETVTAVRALQVIASRRAVPINSAQNSRATSAYRHDRTPDCAGQRSQALTAQVPAGVVRVFLKAALEPGMPLDGLAAPGGRCQALGVGTLCH